MHVANMVIEQLNNAIERGEPITSCRMIVRCISQCLMVGHEYGWRVVHDKVSLDNWPSWAKNLYFHLPISVYWQAIAAEDIEKKIASMYLYLYRCEEWLRVPMALEWDADARVEIKLVELPIHHHTVA